MEFTDYLSLNFIDQHHDSLTLILGTIGGGWALWRYLKSERQAQARTAAEFIRNFSEDEMNKVVMHFLDYWSGVMYVREESDIIEIPCEEKFIITAIRSGYSSFDKALTQHERLIRKTLDHFLTDLEMFDALIDGKVISEKDFGSYFSYWIKRIGYPPKSKNAWSAAPSPLLRNKEFTDALWDYIYTYEFRRVPRLIERVYNFAVK